MDTFLLVDVEDLVTVTDVIKYATIVGREDPDEHQVRSIDPIQIVQLNGDECDHLNLVLEDGSHNVHPALKDGVGRVNIASNNLHQALDNKPDIVYPALRDDYKGKESLDVNQPLEAKDNSTNSLGRVEDCLTNTFKISTNKDVTGIGSDRSHDFNSKQCGGTRTIVIEEIHCEVETIYEVNSSPIDFDVIEKHAELITNQAATVELKSPPDHERIDRIKVSFDKNEETCPNLTDSGPGFIIPIEGEIKTLDLNSKRVIIEEEIFVEHKIVNDMLCPNEFNRDIQIALDSTCDIGLIQHRPQSLVNTDSSFNVETASRTVNTLNLDEGELIQDDRSLVHNSPRNHIPITASLHIERLEKSQDDETACNQLESISVGKETFQENSSFETGLLPSKNIDDVITGVRYITTLCLVEITRAPEDSSSACSKGSTKRPTDTSSSPDPENRQSPPELDSAIWTVTVEQTDQLTSDELKFSLFDRSMTQSFNSNYHSSKQINDQLTQTAGNELITEMRNQDVMEMPEINIDEEISSSDVSASSGTELKAKNADTDDTVGVDDVGDSVGNQLVKDIRAKKIVHQECCVTDLSVSEDDGGRQLANDTNIVSNLTDINVLADDFNVTSALNTIPETVIDDSFCIANKETDIVRQSVWTSDSETILETAVSLNNSTAIRSPSEDNESKLESNSTGVDWSGVDCSGVQDLKGNQEPYQQKQEPDQQKQEPDQQNQEPDQQSQEPNQQNQEPDQQNQVPDQQNDQEPDPCSQFEIVHKVMPQPPSSSMNTDEYDFFLPFNIMPTICEEATNQGKEFQKSTNQDKEFTKSTSPDKKVIQLTNHIEAESNEKNRESADDISNFPFPIIDDLHSPDGNGLFILASTKTKFDSEKTTTEEEEDQAFDNSEVLAVTPSTFRNKHDSGFNELCSSDEEGVFSVVPFDDDGEIDAETDNLKSCVFAGNPYIETSSSGECDIVVKDSSETSSSWKCDIVNSLPDIRGEDGEVFENDNCMTTQLQDTDFDQAQGRLVNVEDELIIPYSQCPDLIFENSDNDEEIDNINSSTSSKKTKKSKSKLTSLLQRYFKRPVATTNIENKDYFSPTKSSKGVILDTDNENSRPEPTTSLLTFKMRMLSLKRKRLSESFFGKEREPSVSTNERSVPSTITNTMTEHEVDQFFELQKVKELFITEENSFITEELSPIAQPPDSDDKSVAKCRPTTEPKTTSHHHPEYDPEFRMDVTSTASAHKNAEPPAKPIHVQSDDIDTTKRCVNNDELQLYDKPCESNKLPTKNNTVDSALMQITKNDKLSYPAVVDNWVVCVGPTSTSEIEDENNELLLSSMSIGDEQKMEIKARYQPDIAATQRILTTLIPKHMLLECDMGSI